MARDRNESLSSAVTLLSLQTLCQLQTPQPLRTTKTANSTESPKDVPKSENTLCVPWGGMAQHIWPGVSHGERVRRTIHDLAHARRALCWV
eukprot:6471323-Amphidinium_carterae.1